ncbi:transmembrane protein 41A-like isoform X9 [Scylla paramamosain]|uniref:transmembrane protein 41A-like isoform X9 n=1 Tax=Scylla paramamosain TaxID=85552 RepID=UPI003083EBCB
MLRCHTSLPKAGIKMGVQDKDYSYLRLLIVPVAFTGASLFLWLLFINRPTIKGGTSPDIHFPTSLKDLRDLVKTSPTYQQDHWYYVLLLFSSAYIYKQTFAIPGSALLVHENEHQLFLFLVSLRVFPMTPNWLLNVIAPYVSVPLPMFFLSVLFGLLPYNFLCVQAGEVLSDMQSMDDVFTPRTLLGLITLALVMFSLSYFTHKSKIKRSE